MDSSPIFKNEIAIQKRIQKAFEADGLDEPTSYDIGFHMTDWLSDVERLVDTFAGIELRSDGEILSFVYQFLAHVPNHLNAAMKLSGLGPVEDVFEVGIFEGEG